MRRPLALPAALLACAALAPGAAGAPSGPALADPFAGTAAGRPDRIPGDAAGGTTPAAALPFGMVSLGPDTVPRGVARGGGYAWEDGRVAGFSPLHVSGGGCGAFRTISLLPVAGAAPLAGPLRAPRLDHASESAAPGRYAAVLDAGTARAIAVRVAATTRGGALELRFPRGRAARVVVAAAHLRHVASGIDARASAGTFCGHDVGARVAVATRFAPRPRTVALRGGRAVATFRPGATVRVALGVSFTSVAGARRNLAAEVGRRSLRALRRTAARAWERAMGRVRVDGGRRRRRDRVVFSTALYHALLAPTAFSDADGRYRSPDGRVRRARGWTRRSTIAGWDAYRAQLPLLAMAFPAIARDTARSLLAAAREGGCLPGWELAGRGLPLMTGHTGATLVAVADAFGAGGSDRRAALRRLVRGAATPCRAGALVERPGLPDELALGWVAADHAGGPAEHAADPAVPWGAAATTLEDAVADGAIARMAARAGDRATAARFAARAGAWRALVDPAARAVRPRGADGAFPATPYDPASADGFVEGSAAQYAWLVPQDPAGLAASMGGRDAALARLREHLRRLAGGPLSAFADLGNEPSFGTPWLAARLGDPALTRTTVRRALLTLYRPAPGGLPGNDDTGSLSAWWVLGALGVYPATPGEDRLVLGSPLFPRAVVRLPRGRLTIAAPGAAPGRPQISAVAFRGHRLRGATVAFSRLAHGGRLAFAPSSVRPTGLSLRRSIG